LVAKSTSLPRKRGFALWAFRGHAKYDFQRSIGAR
jgi:hypothetical protein